MKHRKSRETITKSGPSRNGVARSRSPSPSATGTRPLPPQTSFRNFQRLPRLEIAADVMDTSRALRYSTVRDDRIFFMVLARRRRDPGGGRGMEWGLRTCARPLLGEETTPKRNYSLLAGVTIIVKEEPRWFNRDTQFPSVASVVVHGSACHNRANKNFIARSSNFHVRPPFFFFFFSREGNLR